MDEVTTTSQLSISSPLHTTRSGWAGYEEHAGVRGWLKFHAAPADWRAAAANCLGEDAQLASPWSRAFTAAVSSLQARHGAPVTHSGLRATLPFLSGELPQSLDGSELVRCGVFFANGSTAEMACDRRLPYVCFAPKPAANSRAWPGYEFEAELRGFLKLHSRPADWLAARATCHLEGAFLASPWSPQFSAAIQRLQSGPPPAAAAVFAGVHVLSSFADGAYKYVQGQLVLSLSRSDLIRGERCGVLFANGTEGETACDRRLPFVCYAPVPTAPPADSASDPASASTSAPAATSALASTSAPTSTPSPTTASPDTSPTTAPTSAPTAPMTTPLLRSSTTTTTTKEEPPTVPPTAPTVTTPAPTSAPTSEPKTSPTQTPAPGSTICRDLGLDAGYEWAEETGECYKFHGVVSNWTAANATCAAEGARFGVPGSDEEAQLFTRLLLSNQDKIVAPRNQFKGAVFVGVYYDNGTWVTVDGIPLDESGYSKWWPGWPFDEQRDRRAYLEHTGRLENTSDEALSTFICELAPTTPAKNE